MCAGAELVELRVDRIRDIGAVEALLRAPRSVPLILTVRSAAEGGEWDGNDADRVSLIERLGLHVPGYVDVELATWERSANLRQKIALVCAGRVPIAEADDSGKSWVRAKNALILSHHDLSETPANLERVFDRLCDSPAAIVKAVFTARDVTDAFRVLDQLRRRSNDRGVIALAMGEAGLPTRVLAKKFGAFLTFASLADGAESAPGQPTVDELKRTYRWNSINPQTRVFGVIGWPVAHSLSPRIHNAAMAADGVDGVYLPMPVGPQYADFARCLDFICDNPWLGVSGLSVTIPHKQHAAQWLSERGFPIGAVAEQCGAVNTLVATADSGWRGENTDAAGAVAALESAAPLKNDGLRGQTVDVLGAGGAARAIVAALVDVGCLVTIYNRSAERGRELAALFGCATGEWSARSAGTGRALINCTIVGMAPNEDVSPVAAERMGPGTIVFDTVYNPRETRLLREARQRGSAVVSGVEMFIAQAALQYELWHARRAPVAVMRDTINA